MSERATLWISAFAYELQRSIIQAESVCECLPLHPAMLRGALRNGVKAAKLLNGISQSPSHSRKKRSASVFWHEKTSPLEKDEPTLKRWVLAAGFIAFVSTETNP